MQRLKTSLLIIFAIYLSACRGNIPPAPVVERTILFLESGTEIGNKYLIDQIGGHTVPNTEFRRPISNRSVCFPIEEWAKIAVWRDEVIEWAVDYKKSCGR